jgi:hypothetical protein
MRKLPERFLSGDVPPDQGRIDMDKYRAVVPERKNFFPHPHYELAARRVCQPRWRHGLRWLLWTGVTCIVAGVFVLLFMEGIARQVEFDEGIRAARCQHEPLRSSGYCKGVRP